jgi:HAD superfamily hydrolase (TIGR01509 family)
VVVHRGAVEGLRALRAAGWLIALVTNGDEDEQRTKLRNGMDEAFDTICFSGTEGIRKPDRRIFERAAERLGRPVDGAWVVGDSLEADIGGAAGLGLSSIWVSWGRPEPVGGARPTHVVPHVEEAFPRLLGLAGGERQ